MKIIIHVFMYNISAKRELARMWQYLRHYPGATVKSQSKFIETGEIIHWFITRQDIDDRKISGTKIVDYIDHDDCLDISHINYIKSRII